MKMIEPLPSMRRENGTLKRVSSSQCSQNNFHRIFYNQALPVLNVFANKQTRILLYFLYNADGKPVKEEQEISYTYFRPASIFDISQTEGKALPTLSEELKGEAENYEALMAAIKEAADVPIRFDTWTESKKGYYSLTDQEIVIKSGMSEMQTVKTAIHETAHSTLHTDKEHLKDSATMEVEAESVAYIVCEHFGFDTSDYSFGYLAGWSSNKELPELKASLQTIQKTSDDLIERIEHFMKKYTNNLDISQSLTAEAEQIPGLGGTFQKHTHRR